MAAVCDLKWNVVGRCRNPSLVFCSAGPRVDLGRKFWGHFGPRLMKGDGLVLVDRLTCNALKRATLIGEDFC